MRKMFSNVRRLGCAVLIAVAACGPAAANFTCGGKVTYLGMSPDGLVSVAVGGFGVWYICNQSAPFTNAGITFTPEGCRAWYATFLAAQKSDHSITLFFGSSATSDNGAECTALGTWNYPAIAPYHLTARGS